MKLTSIAQAVACAAGFFCLVAGAASIQHDALLNPAKPDSWVDAWKPAYGCNIERRGAATSANYLRQRCGADSPKGNHAWSARGISITPGAVYEFSALLKYDQVDQAMVQVYFKYPDGRDISRDTSPVIKGTQGQWAPYTFTFKPPAGAVTADIALRLNSAGTICWDDPQLTVKTAAPEVRYSQDAHNYSLEDSVGIVRLFDHQKIADLNIKWIRYNAGWGSAEKKGKGQWDNVFLDKISNDCRKAKEMGMNVMLSLGYPPYWAARNLKGVKNGCHIPRDITEWQTYITNMVTRTRDSVSVYRIMNEPDHQWDTGAQPAEYTEFLKAAYKSVKSVAPKATVVMAGLSGAPCGYLQTMYDNGARGNFDIGACQPYVVGQRSPEEGHQADRLRAYRMVMAANGDNSPLWITEFGYTCAPISQLNQQEQAAYAVRAHLIALSSGAGVCKTFYYLLQDSDGDGCTQVGGMYDRNWNIKPIGTAVKTLAATFNPAHRYVGQVTLPQAPELTAHLFATRSNSHILVVWHPQDTSTPITIKTAKPTTAITWDGQASAPATTHTLTAGLQTLYITGPMDDYARQAVKPKDIGYEAIQTLSKSATPIPWQVSGAPAKTPARIEITDVEHRPRKTLAAANLSAGAAGLSLSFDITDATPARNTHAGLQGLWEQDSVEIFLNTAPEQSPAGFVTPKCRQLILTPGSAQQNIPPRAILASVGGTGKSQLLTVTPTVTLRPDGSGYVMSVTLPWDIVGQTLRAGEQLGFDVLVNIADATGKRIARGAWSGHTGNSTDASLWGRLLLQQ